MKEIIMNALKNAKKKTITFYKKVKENAICVIASATILAPMSSVMIVYATETEPIKIDLIEKVLDIIFTMFRYIGILLLAWSIGMLVLAFKNEDAESKSRAIMMMVVSVVLVSIETLFNKLGVLNGL